jgi:hypothetical protein
MILLKESAKKGGPTTALPMLMPVSGWRNIANFSSFVHRTVSISAV